MLGFPSELIYVFIIDDLDWYRLDCIFINMTKTTFTAILNKKISGNSYSIQETKSCISWKEALRSNGMLIKTWLIILGWSWNSKKIERCLSFPRKSRKTRKKDKRRYKLKIKSSRMNNCSKKRKKLVTWCSSKRGQIPSNSRYFSKMVQ